MAGCQGVTALTSTVASSHWERKEVGMIADIPWYVWLAIFATLAYIWYDWANGPTGPDDYDPEPWWLPEDPYDCDPYWWTEQ